MKRAGSASSLAHLRDVCGKTRALGAHSIYAKIASMLSHGPRLRSYERILDD